GARVVHHDAQVTPEEVVTRPPTHSFQEIVAHPVVRLLPCTRGAGYLPSSHLPGRGASPVWSPRDGRRSLLFPDPVEATKGRRATRSASRNLVELPAERP